MMKKAVVTFSLLLALIAMGHLQALASQLNPSHQDTTRVYNMQEVDQIPKFINQKTSKKAIPEKEGNEELYKFFVQSFRYPADAARARAQGEMIASFVVDKEGNLSDIKLLSSVYPGLDRELIRVIKMTEGRWKPGIKNGNPVSVNYILPYSVRVM